MSRANVTQLIQQLETRLRVTLLHRTTRKVNVTEDGAVYYERVVHMLAELEDLEAGLPNKAATPAGRLRVDVPSPFATMRLVPAQPDFYARYAAARAVAPHRPVPRRALRPGIRLRAAKGR